MPGAEGLGGGSPEIRAPLDQAHVSLGYDPDLIVEPLQPETHADRIEKFGKYIDDGADIDTAYMMAELDKDEPVEGEVVN